MSQQKFFNVWHNSMYQPTLSLFVILSLLGISCATQSLRVDEWNHGIPKLETDPMIQISRTRRTQFSNIQIVDIGKSNFSNHPKTGKAFSTINKAGTSVQAVVTTDNQTNHYYSMSSFKPIILEVVPETAENFDNAKKYAEWSGYAMQGGLGLIAAGALFAPAAVILIYTYGYTALAGISGALAGASSSQYDMIRDKYDFSINQLKAGKNIVETKNSILAPTPPN